MTLSHLLRLSAWIALLAWLAPAQAAEVNWRHDYDQARKEARSLGRPLLVDIGTQACYYCKQLDVTTFCDDAVVQTLNDQFVPVKVDGERYPKLVKALGIESYPTLVFAASAGKILERHEGYLDAAGMKQKLAGIVAGLGATRAATAMTGSVREAAPAAPRATRPASSVAGLKLVKYDELTELVRGQQGKVVVVGVWESSAPDALGHLTHLHDRFGAMGVACVSVNVDPVERRPELINLMAGKNAAVTHLLLDEDRAVWQRRWSVSAAPAVYVFSADGKLACRLTRDDSFGFQEVEHHVRRLIAPPR